MRHEYKHQINYEDYLVIKSRLKTLVKPDSHAGPDGKYLIHSLYFDNLSDKALREKLDGVEKREKFRIRYYNEDTDYIRLEKKCKIYGLCDKYSAPLTKEETIRICHGDIEFLRSAENPLLQELYAKMRYQLLKPRVVVDYEREPFIYGPGNVRITFDSNIRTGLYHNRFFEGDVYTAPTQGSGIILEVKYDAFLPEIVEKAVQIPNRSASAFSKYAACRMYG
jgi:hypothetical protein